MAVLIQRINKVNILKREFKIKNVGIMLNPFLVNRFRNRNDPFL